jgi:hypothetical protein
LRQPKPAHISSRSLQLFKFIKRTSNPNPDLADASSNQFDNVRARRGPVIGEFSFDYSHKTPPTKKNEKAAESSTSRLIHSTNSQIIMIKFVFFLPLFSICDAANYQNAKNRMFNQHHQVNNHEIFTPQHFKNF